MKVHLLKPSELSEDLIEVWSRMLDCDAAFSSPYFSPEFTRAVARCRDDVEVAVFDDGNEVVGFFPFQRRPGNVGKPVGGRLSDFQGVIGHADRIGTARDLLRACQLSVWDFDHLLASQTAFRPYFRLDDDFACIDIREGWEAYIKDKRGTRSDLLQKSNRKYRKMEREIGPIQFKMHVADERLLLKLIEWKSQQYRDTGVTDVFSHSWTVDLLKQIFQHQNEAFGGVLSALFAGDRVVALHMGMRTRNTLHHWFPVYDGTMGKYSPGIMLTLEITKAANRYGIQRVDLGRVSEWKSRFMNSSIAVAEGSVDLRPIRRVLGSRWRQTKEWLRSSPLRTPLKVPARALYRVREWFEFR